MNRQSCFFLNINFLHFHRTHATDSFNNLLPENSQVLDNIHLLDDCNIPKSIIAQVIKRFKSTEPTTKQYVDAKISSSIAASDAMVFKGTGSLDIALF